MSHIVSQTPITRKIQNIYHRNIPHKKPDGPGYIPGRSRPDILGIKANGHRLTLLKYAAGRAVLLGLYTPRTLPCLVTYINSCRISHRLLYHTTTVFFCLYLMENMQAQMQTSNERRRRTDESDPQVRLDHRCRHLEI